ncbi:hypothetical protein [Granulicella arctica]|uniref:hypothetical protein n=1 Tax=Granulicella arctica TaxID=940613 RepID=UPI0021E086D2|nr:hypothetical protein [Granulicella arctica]
MKDTILGVLFLGVLSSLIATYIWENWTKKTDAAAATVASTVPPEIKPEPSTPAELKTDPSGPEIKEIPVNPPVPEPHKDSDPPAGPVSTPTAPTTPVLALPQPEDFERLFPAADKGFKTFRAGKPMEQKTTNGNKLWVSYVTLPEAKECRVSEKPDRLICLLGISADKTEIDKQFATLAQSLHNRWPVTRNSSVYLADQSADFVPMVGPELVVYTKPDPETGGYGLYTMMVKR